MANGSFRKSATDQEMTLLGVCMNAMLDGIAALELQGVLGDGFAASAAPVEAACGGRCNVALSVTGILARPGP